MKTLQPSGVTVRKFPHSVIRVVHQTGTALTKKERGVTVEIHHIDNWPPVLAIVRGELVDHYAEIGLEWDGETLAGYDGVFELPREVLAVLDEMGYNVSRILDCDLCSGPVFPLGKLGSYSWFRCASCGHDVPLIPGKAAA